jgi:hypothetical protein
VGGGPAAAEGPGADHAECGGDLPQGGGVAGEAFFRVDRARDSLLMKLSRRHQKTLQYIFDNPVRADVLWSDIEKLLSALGAELSEGRGSRVRIHLNGVRATFHRPHPEPETDKGALKSMRRFLESAGIHP